MSFRIFWILNGFLEFWKPKKLNRQFADALSDVVKELGDPSDIFYQVALVPKDNNLFAKLPVDYSSVKAVLVFFSVVPFLSIFSNLVVAGKTAKQQCPPYWKRNES